jgi:hypothetical protein
MSVVFSSGVGALSLAGAGCLALFGLPFLGSGILALIRGFHEVQSTSPDENYWVLFAVGGLFFLVGLGLIAAAIFGSRNAAQRGKLKQLHPNQPWLWRPEWKSGRIKGSGRAAMYTA